jgi:hypothetical protein
VTVRDLKRLVDRTALLLKNDEILNKKGTKQVVVARGNISSFIWQNASEEIIKKAKYITVCL